MLLVTDPQGDDRDWQNAARRRSAKASGRSRRSSADDLPRDAASLMPYDCIVFVNVPHDAFDALQLQAVRDAVYNLGIGFLMVGGRTASAPAATTARRSKRCCR